MHPKRFVFVLALLAACSAGSDGRRRSPSVLPAQPLQAQAVRFGEVVVGESRTRELNIVNTSQAPVQVTGISALPAPFEYSAAPLLPFTIPVGGSRRVTLAFAPAGETDHSFEVAVTHAGGGLRTGVSGTGIAAEQVQDFGQVPLDALNRTQELSFFVPPNGVSFTIEALGGSEAVPLGGPLFLSSLRGPNGEIYVDESSPHTGPYFFERNWPAQGLFAPNALPFTPVNHAHFQLPNTDRSDAQLAPGGGSYSFRLASPGGALGSLRVRVVVERRTAGNAGQGHIRLNVFFAAGLALTPAAAPTDVRFQTVLEEADRLLRQTGVGFGRVAYFKVPDPRFDFLATQADMDDLMRQSAAAPGRGVSVFLILGNAGGASGGAAAIPGGKTRGGPYSGVFVVHDGSLSAADQALVVAHEIGHYLGLGHTRELPGVVPYTHDLITDTAECPACPNPPADNNLMDPVSPVTSSSVLTPGQAFVIRRNVLVDAGPPTFQPTVQTSPQSGPAQLGAPGTWCHNCVTGP
ncbi:MAG: zinc-dependent metalloprotease family protein [Planctomycetota bacterium]